MSTNKETIKKYYSLLPDEIKAVYSDPEILDEIYQICVDHGVKHLDQIGNVQDAIYDIMLGLLKPNDFVPFVIKETGLSEDVVNLLTHDINDQILKPIRQQLIDHYQTLEGKNNLPTNVEREDLGFSSQPYENPKSPKEEGEKNDLINELENPVPATVFTRDVFSQKKEGLVSSGQTKEATNLSPTSKKMAPDQAKEAGVKAKSDPYREPID
ncbi:MAG: hypothetical protein WCW56_01975 [Candidatus Paceibacterota bacterium]|jgi:hypothetical protein